MHFSTFSEGFALLTCRFDSLLWKIIPVLLDSGNKVEFFRLTQTSFFVRRKNSTLFPSSSKSGIIFHSALSNLQVRNAKRTEKVEKCISLELLFFSHWEKIFSDAKLPRKYHLTNTINNYRKVLVAKFCFPVNCDKIAITNGQTWKDPHRREATCLLQMQQSI